MSQNVSVITSVKGQFDNASVSASDTSFTISDNVNDSGIHEPEDNNSKEVVLLETEQCE